VGVHACASHVLNRGGLAPAVQGAQADEDSGRSSDAAQGAAEPSAGGDADDGDEEGSVLSAFSESSGGAERGGDDGPGPAAAAFGAPAEGPHGACRPPARPGSIASSYWRPERHDRKELLSVIDER
jgi:hypothetical protein